MSKSQAKTTRQAYYPTMARGVRCALSLALLVSSGGCKAAIGDAPRSSDDASTAPDGPDEITGSDGGIDAALGMFSTPVALPNESTPASEDDPVLSSDGLEIIYAIVITGSGKDLYRATRTSTADDSARRRRCRSSTRRTRKRARACPPTI